MAIINDNWDFSVQAFKSVIFIANCGLLFGVLLSKPQPNLNTTVGFDMKMTLKTPPHPPPQKLFRHF